MKPFFSDNGHGDALVPPGSLLYSAQYTPWLSLQRATLVLARIRLLSGLFAVLTLLWVLIDVAVFPRDIWLELTSLRLLVAMAFALLTQYPRRLRAAGQARVALVLFVAIPLVFFGAATPLTQNLPLAPLGQVVAATYAYLPFIVIACLAIFPLTALEGLLFTVPALGAHLAVALIHPNPGAWAQFSVAWLMVLIALIATVSAMLQLQYMIALMQRTSRDPLTGAYNRETGAELLDIQFHIANRQGASLALAFLDVDNFKSINDLHGHEAGDAVLRGLARALSGTLRAGDTLVRWGGEEFLIILPNTDCATAGHVLARLYERGLGQRPDGQPLTASTGVSELGNDRAGTIRELIEHADRRMYQAKRAGKNRFIVCGNTSAKDQLQTDQ
ncbi:MAG: diguanylate cyclase [Pseudomonadota bacterium]